MLQFLPVQEDNIFAVRATGQLTHDDYQQFLPELEKRISSDSPASLLIELDDFHGWTLDAVRDDFQLGMTHRFNRIALVGTKAWQRWMTAMSKPFVDADIQYFDRDLIGDAWDWLRAADDDIGADITLAPYSDIVIAVDFSPHSRMAALRAIDLADRYNATTTLLHVINEEYLYDILYGPSDIGLTGYATAETFRVNEETLRAQAKKNMDELQEWLQRPDIQSEIIIGSPAHAIVSFAEARRADLIVVGTHGRRGLARLLGSTAKSIVTKSRCEVLSVSLPRTTTQEEAE